MSASGRSPSPATAGRVPSRGQLGRSLLLALAIAIFLLWDYKVALTVVNLAVCLAYVAAVGLRFLAVAASFSARAASGGVAPTLGEADLPVYTVLVPLYHEANVVVDLIASLRSLDYPPAKLDIKLLVEADDQETGQALGALRLPVGFEVVAVPEGQPRTKPRACNVGLALARGEFLTIYDAEDRPDPGQLRQAVAAFRQARPAIVCLQARLLFHNARRNLLTRLFALEYLLWYRHVLPGLVRLGAPIPLGGTSNHFRTDALRQLGGWDPYNVTEDCDLGIRIARAGQQVDMLDSTTWEEANCRLGNWIRQRSRWVKGYAQTHLAHTSSWPRLLADLGWVRTAGFLLTVGAQTAMQLLNPLYWAIMGAWLAWRWPLVYFDPADDFSPGFSPWSVVSWVMFGIALALLFANLLLLVLHAAICLPRRRRILLWAVPALPAYWLLISLGAWKGVVQLFTRPYHWEKTEHGL